MSIEGESIDFQRSVSVDGDWERGYAAGRARNEELWKGARDELERASAENERLRAGINQLRQWRWSLPREAQTVLDALSNEQFRQGEEK